jgi:hypothetical protein
MFSRNLYDVFSCDTQSYESCVPLLIWFKNGTPTIAKLGKDSFFVYWNVTLQYYANHSHESEDCNIFKLIN